MMQGGSSLGNTEDVANISETTRQLMTLTTGMCSVMHSTPLQYQTRTQSLLMSLGEGERRLDSTEARGVTWEGAKEK